MGQSQKSRTPAFVSESVEKVIGIENEAAQPRSKSEFVTELLAGFIGTISFVVVQITAFAGWGGRQWRQSTGNRSIRPVYPLLSSMTSLEAVLIAAFVLMNQNRMDIIANRRDHLDLQVNLLTERRATQVIRMLNRLSVHLGVEQPHDTDSRELERRIAVEHLVEEVHSRLPGEPGV